MRRIARKAPDRAAPPPVPRGPPRLLDQLRLALRSRHYSQRTEQAYCLWVRRFIHFHDLRHPAEMAEPEINAFLTHLAVADKVSASTQNQALSALLFLYRHVLGRQVGELGDVVRARASHRVPVVLTRDEVRAVLAQLDGDPGLLAALMYGTGLRLSECLRLRVKDVDFEQHEITVRAGKGDKDRHTMLPRSLDRPLARTSSAGALGAPPRPRRRLGQRDPARRPRPQVPGRLEGVALAMGVPAGPAVAQRADRTSRADTTYTPASSSEPSRRPSAAPAWQSRPAATRCATPSPPTCSSRATTSGRSRSFSATAA